MGDKERSPHRCPIKSLSLVDNKHEKISMVIKENLNHSMSFYVLTFENQGLHILMQSRRGLKYA